MYLSAHSSTRFLLLAGIAFLCFPHTAHAISTVKSPYTKKDQLSFEYKSEFSEDNEKDKDNIRENVIAVGYGIAERWEIEVEGELKKENDQNTRWSATEFEIKHQLFDKGVFWWDMGVMAKYEQTRDENDLADAMFIAQNDYNQFRTRFNVTIEQELGSDTVNATDLEIQGFVLYKLHSLINPAIEWQADFKEVDGIPSYDKQEHVLGPALYGSLPIAEWTQDALSGDLGYELAYLPGISDAASDHNFRLELEYSIQF